MGCPFCLPPLENPWSSLSSIIFFNLLGFLMREGPSISCFTASSDSWLTKDRWNEAGLTFGKQWSWSRFLVCINKYKYCRFQVVFLWRDSVSMALIYGLLIIIYWSHFQCTSKCFKVKLHWITWPVFILQQDLATNIELYSQFSQCYCCSMRVEF